MVGKCFSNGLYLPLNYCNKCYLNKLLSLGLVLRRTGHQLVLELEYHLKLKFGTSHHQHVTYPDQEIRKLEPFNIEGRREAGLTKLLNIVMLELEMTGLI